MSLYDRSFLRAAQYEFVVIADTHYMLDVRDRAVEFGSRRRQTARAEYALTCVASLKPALVIHMGDLVQEFPERPDFAQAVTEALAQLARHGITPRQVAGNHDVGDKPDPTMPADWVSAEFLAGYHARFGRSWQSWEQDDLHFVILNSQIMNSALPAAEEQWQWLAEDLANAAQQRIFLFLHLPPYLDTPDEPALGHYDNIDEPARGRLLALVEKYGVELMFAAHVHWGFINRFGDTDYRTVPSVAFTRPGFSELFSSPAPPEQGRDDTAKLGFYLVRVFEEGTHVHFLRTDGRSGAVDETPRLVTRTSPDLPHSPLGVVLHHPLVVHGEVPSAWPSTIRQPVRNDYPLQACLELGVRYLRVPLTDLVDPLQRERLALLRRQGVHITATLLWHDHLRLDDQWAAVAADIDALDVMTPGAPWPSGRLCEQLVQTARPCDLEISLSTVVPGRNIRGKQHARSQHAYDPDQLEQLNDHLAQHDVHVDRVLCRIEPAIGAWQTLSHFRDTAALGQIGAVDWVLNAGVRDERTQCNCVAEALFAAALSPGSRMFLEPLLDLDRTMDAGNGLLDRMSNPRDAFHVVRTLNTVLYSRGAAYEPATVAAQVGQQQILGLRTEGREMRLLLPTEEKAEFAYPFGALDARSGIRSLRYFPLVTGGSVDRSGDDAVSRIHVCEPTVVELIRDIHVPQ